MTEVKDWGRGAEILPYLDAFYDGAAPAVVSTASEREKLPVASAEVLAEIIVSAAVDSRYESPLDWQDQALCAQTDPEAFFPEKGGSTKNAKKVCASCDVRSECLDYALKNDERFGVWGGLDQRERRKLKRSTV